MVVEHDQGALASFREMNQSLNIFGHGVTASNDLNLQLKSKHNACLSLRNSHRYMALKRGSSFQLCFIAVSPRERRKRTVVGDFKGVFLPRSLILFAPEVSCFDIARRKLVLAAATEGLL